jgi:hypothetical protein
MSIPPELGRGALDELAAERRVGDVARDTHPDAARLADDVEDPVRILLLLGEIRDGDVGALACEGDRDRGADSRVAAGDECLPTEQSVGAAVRVLAMIRGLPQIGVGAGAVLILSGRVDVGVLLRGVFHGVLIGCHGPMVRPVGFDIEAVALRRPAV